MPQANRNHQLDGSVRNARFTDTGERRCPFYERPARGNPDCYIEILKATDLPPVVQLHEEIHASLRDSGVLYFRDIDFFERLLAGDEGGIVGARAGGRLIGYAAFKRAGGDCGSYHRHLNLPYTDPKLVAETAGSVVHSDFRNHGLHVALCRTRIDVVRSLGFRDLAAVVSVANPAGTATCFRCGLEVRALHYDADGTNLLFHARLVDNRSSGNPPVEHWIKLPDTAEHRAVLAAGFRGVVYHRKAGELQVGYASPPSKPPPQPNKPR